MRKITDEHIKAYQSGVLKKLFNVIKEDPELSFEIRKDNEVMVYYRKGKILTIKYKNEDTYTVRTLDKQYYKDCESSSVSVETDFLTETLKHTDKLRKYFRQAKILVHKHKMGLEFGVQQNIALGNRSFDKRFLVVDMEWQFSQETVRKEDRVGKTRIDLIVIDTHPNEAGTNDIYLAELKVGTEATEGKSGIIDHIWKTNDIISKQEVCDDLKCDVENVIDIKSKLGLISGKKKTLKLSSKPKMMIILVYRGEEERTRLEQQAEIAINEAKRIGMSKPLIQYFDLRMTLA